MQTTGTLCCRVYFWTTQGLWSIAVPTDLFYGTDGWHINLKLANSKKLTALVYYHYHIIRQNVSVLLKAQCLFQQFLIDLYCKIETEFLRREQKALYADYYQDLWDAIIDGDGDPSNELFFHQRLTVGHITCMNNNKMPWLMLESLDHLIYLLLSYSTVVLYIGIMKVWGF